MRTSQYSTAALIDLFRQQTVATLAEVMTALGTGARRTAFRKLKEIPYRASYSNGCDPQWFLRQRIRGTRYA